MLLFFGLFPTPLLADTQTATYTSTIGPTTTLNVHNRSTYEMVSSIWNEGTDCTDRMLFEPPQPPLNINGNEPAAVTVPAARTIAIGVAIYDMKDKTPVVCDYILSFALDPSKNYLLDYDVYNRRCFGQLFRQEGEVYKLVKDGDPENFVERYPEFGWDQFEPGCMLE